MIEPRYLSVLTKRARYTKEVEREDGNMSITRSISVAQTNNSSKSKLLCRLFLLLKPCETVQGKADDNMSITRSISVAQTDNRVVKANCYVHYSFY